MILIGRHRTEMGKFFIFTPASSHRALRVSQSTPYLRQPPAPLHSRPRTSPVALDGSAASTDTPWS